MTPGGTPHLQVVVEEPEPVRAPSAGWGPLLATTAALAVVLGLLAGQRWELPARAAGMVSDVPQSLVCFLLVCAGACLWAAGKTTRPAGTFRSATSAQLWWVLTAGAAVVSITADVSLAADAGTDLQPTALMARWLVPFVPAVLAGVLARRDGRSARIRAALGTGAVTLPLFAVGWALYASPGGVALAPADVVSMVLMAGAAPFALAVAFVAAERRP